MRINKYSPVAFIYFFVNKVGLPFGLLYTTLLTPFFYVWLLLKGKNHILFKFLAVAVPFMIAHLVNGVRIVDYLRTLVVLFSVYVFTYTVYVFVNRYDRLDHIFRQLLVTNFILCLIAIAAFFTPLRDLFWIQQYITDGVGVLSRLRMFTYEASYYATLFAPVFLYYALRILNGQQKATVTLLLMLVLPLLLSFSMGVIASCGIGLSFFFVLQVFRLRIKRNIALISLYGLLAALVIGIILFVFYPDNPLFVRIGNVVAGADISGRGRTLEAFQLAYIIAEQKSIWWGVGPGQLKIIGDPIIKEFYQYPPDFGQVSIPCALAETLAIFGIFGMTLRVIVEIVLFINTRVWQNHYQTVLFFYIFVYQFTGSFITNIAEYVIWVLAFSNVFKEMNQGRPLPTKVTPLPQG
jgi:hypothetical protein